jgi:hypothetical protein
MEGDERLGVVRMYVAGEGGPSGQPSTFLHHHRVGGRPAGTIPLVP